MNNLQTCLGFLGGAIYPVVMAEILHNSWCLWPALSGWFRGFFCHRSFLNDFEKFLGWSSAEDYHTFHNKLWIKHWGQSTELWVSLLYLEKGLLNSNIISRRGPCPEGCIEQSWDFWSVDIGFSLLVPPQSIYAILFKYLQINRLAFNDDTRTQRWRKYLAILHYRNNTCNRFWG